MERKPLHRRRWFQIAVSALVLAVLASNLEFATLARFVTGVHPGFLVALAVLYPADRVFMAWKWHLLVRAEGSPMSLWTAIRIYQASGVVGLIMPLGGAGPDVVRVAMLKHHGMPMQLAVPSILVERACGILAAGMMVVVSLGLLLVLLQPEAGTPLARAAWISGWTGVIVGAGIAAIYAAVRIPTVGRVLGRIVDRLRLGSHFETLTSYARKGYLLAVSVLLSFVPNIIGIVGFYLVARAFAVDLTVLEAAAVVPFAAILERLPISWGGIGIREAGVVFVAGLFGVDAGDALLLSLTNYTLYLVVTVPLAAFYFVERKADSSIAEVLWQHRADTGSTGGSGG